MEIKVKKIRPDAKLPTYAHAEDGGMDLYAAEKVHLCCGDVVTIPAGIAVAIPKGWYMQIVPRSGLSLKSNLRIANAPGLVDCGYTSELMVIVENLGEAYTIRKGDRIAQLLLQKRRQIDWVEVDELDDTERGSGGFGSTGV